MWVRVNGTNATEIENSVVQRVLDLYPEEKLITRKVFQNAFSDGAVEFNDLKEESEKILIPWQMFFLTEGNLNQQLSHIEDQRQNKVSSRLVAKRRGVGEVTSKRIVDRLIRQQEFLAGLGTFPQNTFCDSLKGLSTENASNQILSHFGISREYLRREDVSKGRILEYLIGKVNDQNINVSRGSLSHKILPHSRVVAGELYKNTSGFVIKDERVPFIFLPDEINPDEVESRQIYTLVYLLVVIGLGQYDYFLDANFKAKILNATRTEGRLHRVTTEFLIPTSETDKLARGITVAERDRLAQKFKMSPSALVYTLRRRRVLSYRQFNNLKPPTYQPRKNGYKRSPHVKTAVKKFCGQKVFDAINAGISNGSLKNVEAQHLIFGFPNKKSYRQYRNELNI